MDRERTRAYSNSGYNIICSRSFDNFVFIVVMVFVASLWSFGNGLYLSAWTHATDEKAPRGLTKSCQHLFRQHFSTKLSYRELLFDYPEDRIEMCKELRHGNINNTRLDTALQVACSRKALGVLDDFLCYNLNTSYNDYASPPITISKSCAMRVWKCARVQHYYIDRLNIAQKLEMCREKYLKGHCWGSSYVSCFGRTPRSSYKRYMCSKKMPRSTSYIDDGCDIWLLDCSPAHFDIFKILLDMTSLESQPYLCGRMEECLVTDDADYPGNIMCTRTQARIAERYLCSNTRFTQDVYGLYMLSETCRLSASKHYRLNSLDDLHWDIGKRRANCKTQDRGEPHYCTEREVMIINDYLCFAPDHIMLLVTEKCRTVVAYMNKRRLSRKHLDLTFAEFDAERRFKWCQFLPTVNICDEDRFNFCCTENEREYLADYLCTISTDNCIVTKSNTFLIGTIIVALVFAFQEGHRVHS